MDSVDRLAKKLADMHQKNTNPPSTACRVGTVVSVSPLKIQWGEHIVLTADKLVVPKLYREGYNIPCRWQDTTGNRIDAEMTLKVELKKGDKVMIAPDADMKLFYVLAEV